MSEMVSLCYATNRYLYLIKCLKFLELTGSNMLALTNVAMAFNLAVIVKVKNMEFRFVFHACSCWPEAPARVWSLRVPIVSSCTYHVVMLLGDILLPGDVLRGLKFLCRMTSPERRLFASRVQDTSTRPWPVHRSPHLFISASLLVFRSTDSVCNFAMSGSGHVYKRINS